MLVTGSAHHQGWGRVGSGLIAGLVVWGCAAQEAPQPPQATVEVSKRLTMLEGCVSRSQQVVQAAAEAGVSGGALAPANSGIADAQDAVDDVKNLVRQSKTLEATERATKGLEECEKIEAMVAKGRQEALERKARVQMATEAEGRLPPIATCVDGARQALRNATATKAKAADLAVVRGAFDNAETALKQAREFLAQNDPKSALGRLDAAQADCKTAREAGEKITAMSPHGKAAAAKAKARR